MRSEEILKAFEHVEAPARSELLFGDELIVKADQIRRIYKWLSYDHKNRLPYAALKQEFGWVVSEEFRKSYACFKYAVAIVLQPKTIIEIGVGAGISALAFLAACPEASYLGIDLDTQESFYDLGEATKKIASVSRSTRILSVDSRSLQPEDLPKVSDLFHIDGGHDFETAKNDMMLAWKSESKWILVDDANDSSVAAGVFSAIVEVPHGKTDYAYFEDTWAGNLLFRRTG